MNPGLVVKLRPAGPWRIGPDSGVRNRVDVIYHSDSLYSAVTSAMSRMGSLEGWLDATARNQTPAVSFSSCFPFLADTAFVVPPRTIWPPTSPAAMSARVRWKSARFIPLTMVESMLEGRKLNDSQWSVDGASGCLVPAGKPGPFRTSVRWNAAIDRLTGASERHATACIEFREGCGLWTVVSFRDDAARDQWQDAVKAAFRLLADSGFGGERSRGWGRAETPEFVEGTLPGLIIEYKHRAQSPSPPIEEPPDEAEPPVTEPPPEEEPPIPQEGTSEQAAAPASDVEPAVAGAAPAPETAAPPAEPEPTAPGAEAATPESTTAPESAAPTTENAEPPAPTAPVTEAAPESTTSPESESAAPPAPVTEAATPGSTPAPESAAPTTEGAAPRVEPEPTAPVADAATPESTTAPESASPASEGAPPPVEPEPTAPVADAATPESTTAPESAAPASEGAPPPPPAESEPSAPADAAAHEAAPPTPAPPQNDSPESLVDYVLSLAAAEGQPVTPTEAAVRAPKLSQPMRVSPERDSAPAPPTVPLQAHWLLSLFTPAPADAVDWGRGSYTVLARGGRIDSPALGSGELKKQIQMVAEGSVLYSDGVPLGAAADVAPDGFAHPVFRAGFALAIPLPEVH